MYIGECVGGPWNGRVLSRRLVFVPVPSLSPNKVYQWNSQNSQWIWEGE